MVGNLETKSFILAVEKMSFCFMRTIFSGGRADVDEAKLEKLLKRQKIYGDITQVGSERERERDI